MSQPQAPRVKLPEVTPPKLTLSAPNTWTTKQAQTRNKTPTATHRDKYENKPMPPTPEASPSPAEKPLTARKNRGYIQPAIPLASPSQAIANMKNRAVTDPVMPKPLFTSTTSTVNQLRKKYSHSRSSRKSKEEEENSNQRFASPPAALTHKASQILGVYPVKDNSHGKPPSSAPPSTHTPDPFRTSSESVSGRHVSPNRQVHSTPVPTRRYLQENGMPPLPGARASQESREAHNVPAEEDDQFHLRSGSDGLLNATRFVTRSGKGEVEYVNKNGMQRVPSFAGIIEQPESPRVGEGPTEPDGLRIDWNETTLRPQYSGEILQPMVYTPSNYAGVWENDPNVGRTLPPFSPYPQQSPAEDGRRAMSPTSGDIPMILQRFPGESSHGSVYTRSIQSQNSWATSGNGNSYAQPGPPSSGAGTTPRIPTHMRNNSVPPPPMSYPGFQPSGPLPPGLAQIEMNLHHHIETCFGSLGRMTTDHADRSVDKMVRRVEDLQETFEKGLKGLRCEVKDVRKELASMRKEMIERPRMSESIKESIGSLGEKLGHLDRKIDGIGSHYRRIAAGLTEGEREVSSGYSQSKEPPHKRSQSAHTSASSRPEQGQEYTSGTAHAVANTNNSVHSNRGRRSDTAKVSGTGVRRSGERSTRPENNAETGAANAQVPDIRDHPAYRGVTESHGLSSPIYQTPNYEEIWYQEAFGRRQ